MMGRRKRVEGRRLRGRTVQSSRGWGGLIVIEEIFHLSGLHFTQPEQGTQLNEFICELLKIKRRFPTNEIRS